MPRKEKQTKRMALSTMRIATFRNLIWILIYQAESSLILVNPFRFLVHTVQRKKHTHKASTTSSPVTAKRALNWSEVVVAANERVARSCFSEGPVPFHFASDQEERAKGRREAGSAVFAMMNACTIIGKRGWGLTGSHHKR